MKTANKCTWAEHILIAFYATLFSIPALIHDGYNLEQSFLLIFKTVPSNYLLFLSPLILYIFIKKSNISKQEKFIFSALINLCIIMIILLELSSSSGKLYFTAIAILILSFLCINTNTLTSSFILIPGLFITKLGLFYIFSAFIPILFLIMIKTSNTQTAEKSEKKSSIMIYFAYMYILLLTIILLFKKKFAVNETYITPYLSHADDIINLISGITILIFCCILFIYRASNRLKNGSYTEKVAIILASVYPLLFATLGTFTNIISYNFKSAFTVSLLMYTTNHFQLSVTYDNDREFIPKNFLNEKTAVAAILIFCAFFFKSKI